jgi:outer membrane protein assembly factor BamD (BamD/ComL family)
MKKAFLFLSLFTFVFAFSPDVFAQRQIEQQVRRDPILEADANHNLEAAQLYFRTRKAYKAVLMRFEETFAAYPDYSKMDEFLYLAAMSSYYLSEGKGKQKIDLKTLSEEEQKKYAPAKLREDAVAYFAMIIEKYPQSRFKSDAEKVLKEIQGK